MGASGSKKRRKSLSAKTRARGYENMEKAAVNMMVFACREAEWVKERKKLTEEVKMLRRLAAEKEEKIQERRLAEEKMQEMADKGWPLLGTSYLLEQMKEERARRDEVVEKWKQLYLAIRTELHDLIQTTHGDAIYWKAEEEETMEEMKKELKSKEETIKALRGRIASMEKEGFKRKREMDILKQSLRILDSRMKSAYTSSNNLPHYLRN